MALSPDDRKSFSLKIANADGEVALFAQAKGQLAAELDKLQKLDTANKNLFDPINVMVNRYQSEIAKLDGITRTTYAEQDILDAAAFKIGNYFYPNNTSITVPSLAGQNNVWTKPKPFALTYGIGKNYTEGQGTNQKELDVLNPVLAAITAINAFPVLELATGLKLQAPAGSCSLPAYTDQATCELNAGVWTPGTGPGTLVTNAPVVAAKDTLVAAIGTFKSFLQTEVSLIVTDDKDNAVQAQNTAAINNINNVIIPALDTWLAYVNFNTTGVTASNWNTFDASTLAPTKLSAPQIAALTSAVNARASFIPTRVGQLNTVIGTISQDISTGDITGSGLYNKRYGFLLLRLDILNGSLSKLNSMKNATGAQDSIIASVKTNKQTYLSVVPTSLLSAPGNDTSLIQLVDASAFAVGDTVWIMAEGQEELQRAIKSINGKAITLNDIVPAKYKTANKLRIYKDIS